jgi:hypothetical protein
MNGCPHDRQQGDNYGRSCMDCKERLAGFGYWGSHQDCLHEWIPHGDSMVCTFCESIVPKEEILDVEN